MYPLLSLSQIPIDPELARRLPRRLAYYHLALPIAQEEDAITLAMAYPENRRIVEVIQTALGMPVIPVRSHAEDIRRALDNLWSGEGEARWSGLMGWAAQEQDVNGLAGYSQSLKDALAIPESTPISQSSAADFIAQVNAQHPTLAVCAVSDLAICQMLISGISTSLVLLRDAFAPPKTILHALRGHTPDQHALDWLMPMAQFYEAQITLLAAANTFQTKQGSAFMGDIARLILPEHPAQVIEYGHMLASMNLRGRIKLSDGLLEDALIQTLKGTPHDLVAIAAENDGRFVQNVLNRLEDVRGAFLVIKP